MVLPRACCRLAMFALVSQPGAWAGSSCADELAAASRTTAGALQVLADLTLIDGACRSEVVNFGVGFRFAAREGIPEASIMPGGPYRADFERTLRARRASFDRDELCGEIAANYAEALPGSVTFSTEAAERH